MTMTLDRHHLILYAALALAICIGAAVWHEREVDTIRAKAEIDAQSQIAKQAQTEAAQAAEREKQRDAAAAAQLTAMQTAMAKVQTPHQITNWIPQQPGFEALQSLQAPPATPQNSAPNATASIPVAQLPTLRDTIEKCQECSLKLATAQQDLNSKDDRLRLAGEQLAAANKERDGYKELAKGGSFFTRLKRDVKWLAIGGAIGGAAICASGHC